MVGVCLGGCGCGVVVEAEDEVIVEEFGLVVEVVPLKEFGASSVVFATVSVTSL